MGASGGGGGEGIGGVTHFEKITAALCKSSGLVVKKIGILKSLCNGGWQLYGYGVDPKQPLYPLGILHCHVTTKFYLRWYCK
jgi:hypothetical protein